MFTTLLLRLSVSFHVVHGLLREPEVTCSAVF